ncbi:DUF1365 domain-containing protein [Thiomicrorhabdus immobilis]|uniref:DUF1365 domain-containing protein n=1 Tax=Thiomicrorhabdus immobilis TaxID=2791037 RepID=A0ABN6D0D4_9GAMM|nr:DUF1365 domain-containing protein [Thiomicrorhabdus immobilis]BCN94359.1 DUF1365 domain-containing protein [Thiomicrorhabdus immobilis]
MPSQIYLGQVMHQRFFPMQYQFRYGVMSLRVDIDQIETEAKKSTWLSLNRFNLFSLHFKDYGARQTDQAWRIWADSLLAEYGLPEPAHKIELVCFPRFMNIAFNPLAMWYAYDQQGKMIAIIGEVSNTFGQWHHYVLTDKGRPLADSIKAQAKKDFHVSPFIGMDCQYQFRFNKPSAHYKIGIYQTENSQQVLTATQVGQAQDLNDSNLLKAALKHPFNSLKVLWMIHWWAIKIWVKGGRFHRTPEQQVGIDYSHTEMHLC